MFVVIDYGYGHHPHHGVSYVHRHDMHGYATNDYGYGTYHPSYGYGHGYGHGYGYGHHPHHTTYLYPAPHHGYGHHYGYGR